MTIQHVIPPLGQEGRYGNDSFLCERQKRIQKIYNDYIAEHAGIICDLGLLTVVAIMMGHTTDSTTYAKASCVLIGIIIKIFYTICSSFPIIVDLGPRHPVPCYSIWTDDVSTMYLPQDTFAFPEKLREAGITPATNEQIAEFREKVVKSRERRNQVGRQQFLEERLGFFSFREKLMAQADKHKLRPAAGS